MTPFKLGEEKFEIPSSYNGLKVSQYLAIRALESENNLPQLMSILSGLEIDKWENAAMTDKEISVLSTFLDWMKDVPDFEALEVPKQMTIGEKVIDIPQRLDILPLACKMYFEQKVYPLSNIVKDEEGMEKLESIQPEAIPFALSAYLYKPITGEQKFKTINIEEVEKKIGECKITEAYPVAAFFLRVCLGSENEKKKYNIPTTQTKRRPVLELLDNLAT